MKLIETTAVLVNFNSKKMLLAYMLIACLLLACGRKDAPEPPEAYAPKAVQFLKAEGVVGGVLLRWQSPTVDEKGEELLDLDGYSILRSNYIKDKLPNYREIAEVEQPELEETSASAGKKASEPQIVELTFKDVTVEVGKQYQYKVLALNEDGVTGRASVILRVTYAGQASVIENLQPGKEEF